MSSDAAKVKTPATMVRMPNQPKTPLSNFRIPQELKAKAQAKAASEGKTLSGVVIELLTRYVKGWKQATPSTDSKEMP